MISEKKKVFILALLFAAVVVAGFFIIGSLPNVVNEGDYVQEQQHLYWKELPCKVLDVNKSMTFNVHVYNEEYGVERTFKLWGKQYEKYKDVKAGDTIICTMYSWVIEGSNDVASRTLMLAE